jgi:hypothetical protein
MRKTSSKYPFLRDLEGTRVLSENVTQLQARAYYVRFSDSLAIKSTVSARSTSWADAHPADPRRPTAFASIQPRWAPSTIFSVIFLPSAHYGFLSLWEIRYDPPLFREVGCNISLKGSLTGFLTDPPFQYLRFNITKSKSSKMQR